MKKTLVLSAFALMIATTFVSCKKSGGDTTTPTGNDTTATNPTSTTSTWSFRGVNYTGDANSNLNNSVTASQGTNGNSVLIKFGAAPVNGKKYGVIVQTGGTTGANNCLVYVTVNNSTYYSTGNTGDSVTVSISGGYTIATFSNISVASTPGSSTPYLLSGNVAAN